MDKIINIEFFDEESIENLITCLKFKIDKTIFFGHKHTMTQERKQITEQFLKNRCGVKEVQFIPVTEYILEQVVEQIETVLKEECEQGNQCYFDLTGGKDLILVAIGILSERYQIPIHKYDIERDLLIGFHRESGEKINKKVAKQDIKLTLDDLIQMQGGCINYKKQKLYKDNLDDESFRTDIEAMWEIVKSNAIKWNAFSAVLKECNKYKMGPETIEVSKRNWQSCLTARKATISLDDVEKILNTLQNMKVLSWTKDSAGNIKITYKNQNIREVILDAGCLLELSTYYERKNSGKYSDVRVGVHLDWDGKLDSKEKDVENEVDVMALEGNIPIFISCKNGEVTPVALYELDAITRELGGKHAKKELVIGATMTKVQRERAQRMDIAVFDACK